MTQTTCAAEPRIRPESWTAIVDKTAPELAGRAAHHDAEGTPVLCNYELLKGHRFLSAGVPTDLAGGGASHAELCEILRSLAHHCPSTAPALSMHPPTSMPQRRPAPSHGVWSSHARASGSTDRWAR